MRAVVDDPEAARERGAARPERASRAGSRSSVPRRSSPSACRSSSGLKTERDNRETPGTRAAQFLAGGPSLSWDAPSRSGAVGRLWRRVLLRLLRPYLVRQRELETLVVMGLDELERSRDRLEDAVRQLAEPRPTELHAKPYTADGGRRRRAAPTHAFEDVFRGPEERVRELLEPYVELLRGHEPVLDLGCGRGELLELLAEAGIEASGVDVDQGMVERSRAKGLAVEQADAVSYLEAQPEGSLGAVVAIHVIEHLAYEELQRLLELARRALRPGGLFVAETVNPHSVQAFKTFWVDPTHRAPIFPEVAQHACADPRLLRRGDRLPARQRRRRGPTGSARPSTPSSPGSSPAGRAGAGSGSRARGYPRLQYLRGNRRRRDVERQPASALRRREGTVNRAMRPGRAVVWARTRWVAESWRRSSGVRIDAGIAEQCHRERPPAAAEDRERDLRTGPESSNKCPRPAWPARRAVAPGRG